MNSNIMNVWCPNIRVRRWRQGIEGSVRNDYFTRRAWMSVGMPQKVTLSGRRTKKKLLDTPVIWYLKTLISIFCMVGNIETSLFDSMWSDETRTELPRAVGNEFQSLSKLSNSSTTGDASQIRNVVAKSRRNTILATREIWNSEVSNGRY